MTTKDKVARRKLSLLELATDLDNVSKACKLMGYSRQQFYEIRRNFQTYGAQGLIDRLPGPRGPHPNRVPEEVEQAILAHALDHPSHGPLRVAQELTLQGIQVSSGGVRGVWGRLYTAKLPVTAVHVMNNDVLPTFEQHGARITTVLSDNGREYCGRPDKHPYELFLQLEEIKHRTTKVRRPQSNGFVERLHRTLLDEHFRVMGRTKFYDSVDEMQKDLDAYLVTYNTKRPHQGRGMQGRTPATVFVAGLPKVKNRKEVKPKKAA